MIGERRCHDRADLGVDRHGAGLEVEVEVVLQLRGGRVAVKGAVLPHVVSQRDVPVGVVLLRQKDPVVEADVARTAAGEAAIEADDLVEARGWLLCRLDEAGHDDGAGVDERIVREALRVETKLVERAAARLEPHVLVHRRAPSRRLQVASEAVVERLARALQTIGRTAVADR